MYYAWKAFMQCFFIQMCHKTPSFSYGECQVGRKKWKGKYGNKRNCSEL